MNDQLTQEELQELTGSKQIGGQEEVLLAAKIYYFRANDGKLRTTWTWVHRAPGDGATIKTDGPRLDLVNGG